MNTKLTPEQKKERKEQRSRDYKERQARFPSFGISSARETDEWVQVNLNSFSPYSLMVRWRGSPWKREAEWPDVSVAYVNIMDINSLADLIHALMARYNVLVDKANTAAKECTMKRIDPIKP